MFAGIDPQAAPLVGAVAMLLTALGVSEWRRRKNARPHPFVGSADLDRQAAETLLTQWQRTLEAVQAQREWEASQHRRCEENHKEFVAISLKREEASSEAVNQLKWELARRDWLDTQPKRKGRRDDVR